MHGKWHFTKGTLAQDSANSVELTGGWWSWIVVLKVQLNHSFKLFDIFEEHGLFTQLFIRHASQATELRFCLKLRLLSWAWYNIVHLWCLKVIYRLFRDKNLIFILDDRDRSYLLTVNLLTWSILLHLRGRVFVGSLLARSEIIFIRGCPRRCWLLYRDLAFLIVASIDDFAAQDWGSLFTPHLFSAMYSRLWHLRLLILLFHLSLCFDLGLWLFNWCMMILLWLRLAFRLACILVN